MKRKPTEKTDEPMRPRVTLRDLAKQLKVSVPTVSRALNNSPEISPRLRQRVHKLAEKWNYRPNPFAQSLRKGSPKLIGVVVPNIVTHFHSGVIAGIEDYARQQGYSVIAANSHEQTADEMLLLNNMASLHVEGIIVSLAENTTDYSHFLKLREMNIPVVFFARTCLPELFSSVTADGVKAAYEATTHLIGQGCRRIAFIGGPNHLDMVKRRKHGYLEALRDAHIPINRRLVRCDSMTLEASYQQMAQLLEGDDEERPDGVLAVNNTLIYGAMKAIKDHQLHMPTDIRLIGFTDDENVSYLSPAISAIEDQAHLMGERACKQLIARINGDTTILHETIPMRLVFRESS